MAILHEGRVAATGTLAEIITAHPARFSAALPAHVVDLPQLAGSVQHDADRVQVQTTDLQGT